MRCRLALSLSVFAGIACTDLSPAAPEPGPDDGAGSVMGHTQKPAENGQTTSIGSSPMCDPMQCAEVAQEQVREFAARTGQEPALRHTECVSGQCMLVVRLGAACHATLSLYLLQAPESCAASDAELIESYLEASSAPSAPVCPAGGGAPAPIGGGAPAPIGGGTLSGAPIAMPVSTPSTDTCIGGVVSQPEVCVGRAPAEWQGMKVCGPYPPCEESAYCGLALACVDGLCGACTRDADCASGEGCVLDHCVRRENLGCRSVTECPPDNYCILSGITGGTARGNEDMRAYCNPNSGGTPQTMR